MASQVTPNMGLVVPGTGTEAGPDYANEINNDLSVLDAHDHRLGSGVQITPAGININASFPLNNNALTSIAALTLSPQVTDAAINSLYEKGVDLYYKDGNGNVIRVTQSGSVVGSSGTITGLPSGTASASYSAGTFTFQSASLTAANIDAASYVFRNSTPSSNGITLQPPASIPSSYLLTLPSLPAQTNVMSLDSSGNMASITYDAVGQGMTSTGANSIAAAVTRPLNSGTALGVGQSGASTFSTTSTGPVTVVGLTATIVTTGKAVYVGLVGNETAAFASGANISSNSLATIQFVRNAVTSLGGVSFNGGVTAPSALSTIDTGVIGAPNTYAYTIQAGVQAGSISFNNVKIIAYEIT